MQEGDIRLEHQRRIYGFIGVNPGSHLRLISREVGISLSTLRYHIEILEKNELVVARKEKNLKVYFIVGRMKGTDRNVASLLQQKRFRDIVLTILIHPGATHADISDKLSLKPPTLTKYMKVLEKRGIVDVVREGRCKKYTLVDEKGVTELLLTYRRSFWDSFVDNVLEIYFER